VIPSSFFAVVYVLITAVHRIKNHFSFPTRYNQAPFFEGEREGLRYLALVNIHRHYRLPSLRSSELNPKCAHAVVTTQW
jgi:hypothetical protein